LLLLDKNNDEDFCLAGNLRNPEHADHSVRGMSSTF
jgi:hypothetical protein